MSTCSCLKCILPLTSLMLPPQMGFRFFCCAKMLSWKQKILLCNLFCFLLTRKQLAWVCRRCIQQAPVWFSHSDPSGESCSAVFSSCLWSSAGEKGILWNERLDFSVQGPLVLSASERHLCVVFGGWAPSTMSKKANPKAGFAFTLLSQTQLSLKMTSASSALFVSMQESVDDPSGEILAIK